MSPDDALLTAEERDDRSNDTMLVRGALEEQFAEPRPAAPGGRRWACGSSWPPR